MQPYPLEPLLICVLQYRLNSQSFHLTHFSFFSFALTSTLLLSLSYLSFSSFSSSSKPRSFKSPWCLLFLCHKHSSTRSSNGWKLLVTQFSVQMSPLHRGLPYSLCLLLLPSSHCCHITLIYLFSYFLPLHNLSEKFLLMLLKPFAS